jgi:ADP-ribose pyrophosphatase
MKARVHHKEIIRHGRVFDVTLENVSLPNGASIDMEIIRHPGAAAIAALTETEEILMLRQYRHAIGDYWWEIPAGTFIGNEEPIGCAQRELAEETGYTAKRWESLGAVTPVPGYSDERIHLFMATGLSQVGSHLDFDEIIEVHPLPLNRVVAMIVEGHIEDAKTIAAVFRVLNKLEQPVKGGRNADPLDH